jgi:hypothetical protein
VREITRDEWAKIIREYREKGESCLSFCLGRDIPFGAMQRRLAEVGRQRTGDNPLFVEIKPTTSMKRYVPLIPLFLFGFFLFYISRFIPLTFDDAFNANVSLSFATGRGYATHAGEIPIPFNPRISTGMLFIGPYSAIIWAFGASIGGLQAYSLLVSFFFFTIAWWQARKIDSGFALILIIFSFLFLKLGKTDLVTGTAIPNLPPPPYGFWIQFLGNMAGIWAVIGTILLCSADSPTSLRRLLATFCLTVFAVNAKIIHALPLIVALGILLLGRTRQTRWGVFVAILATLLGVRSEPLIAWINLDSEQFHQYEDGARAFFDAYQGLYRELLLSPRWELCKTILGTIPMRIGLAAEYIGLPLLIVYGFVVTVSVVGFLHSKDTATTKILVRAELAMAAAALAVVLWWCGMPQAPSRFLSVVAPLLVTAAAAASARLLQTYLWIHRPAVFVFLLIVMPLFCWSSMQHDIPALRWAYAVRREQQQVNLIVKENRVGDTLMPLCGHDWWYPHEISFLIGKPVTISCSRRTPRVVVMPRHIFPDTIRNVLISSDCTTVHSGEFYEVAHCGFRTTS